MAVNFVIFSLVQRWNIRDSIWRTEGKNTGLTNELLSAWVSPKLAWSAGLIGQLTKQLTTFGGLFSNVRNDMRNEDTHAACF